MLSRNMHLKWIVQGEMAKNIGVFGFTHGVYVNFSEVNYNVVFLKK